MFRIRRIYDNVIPSNKKSVSEVQSLIRSQFPGVPEEEIESLTFKLRNPFKYRFRSILFVADNQHGKFLGFALLMHAPDLDFCYLDFISAACGLTGRGVGGALYERVREEAAALAGNGLFFECLPDDPALCKDPVILKQNIARLKFYERYGARPITGTAYETPVKPDGDNPPYLLFDNLGSGKSLPLAVARKIVDAILERKYSALCKPSYINMVVNSFHDDPVLIRSPRYSRKMDSPPMPSSPPVEKIALVINKQHGIHHVKDRGYVESPARVESIVKELAKTNIFRELEAKSHSERFILGTHDPKYFNYFKSVCSRLERDLPVYPYVFPIRNQSRPPKDLAVRAGYYCIDTFTPLDGNAFSAACGAVDCALTCADKILAGESRFAYALVRPPGHHAEKGFFGGFCYFNSAAIAANLLSEHGKVAMLDIDYHHGNGQQSIFYERDDVYTVSIHGHPSFAYPYFSGFENECGSGQGLGYNVNIPLPEQIEPSRYREALASALSKIKRFAPDFLVLSFGLDTAKGDPTGTWTLDANDFYLNGKLIGGALSVPVLVVQEGGYRIKSMGVNARNFFTGLLEGFCEKTQKRP